MPLALAYAYSKMDDHKSQAQPQPQPDVVQPIDPFPQMMAPSVAPTGPLAGQLLPPPRAKLTSTKVVLILLALMVVAVAIRVGLGHSSGSSSSAGTDSIIPKSVTNNLGTSSTQQNQGPNSFGGIDKQTQSAENSCAASPLTNC
jgi:hypothetical protein